MFIFIIVKCINKPEGGSFQIIQSWNQMGLSAINFMTRQQIKSLNLITVCTPVLFSLLMVSTQAQHSRSYRCTLSTAHVGKRLRNLGMLLHVRGTRCQNCAWNLPSIQNCLASTRTSVHLCSCEHTEKTSQDVWKGVGD